MRSRVLKRPRTKPAIVLVGCIALLIMSVSHGRGATEAVPTLFDSPSISSSPVSLSVARQPLESSSSVQSLTLTNAGNAALTTSSATTSGEFTQTNNCGTSVAPGNSCTISVVFTPTGSGALSVSDNAAGSPQPLSLSGTGAAPAVSLSPTSLAFGNQSVGTTSTAQTLTGPLHTAQIMHGLKVELASESVS
jgi:archaellum component FlaF (FlaF/FlaG flagellin family)